MCRRTLHGNCLLIEILPKIILVLVSSSESEERRVFIDAAAPTCVPLCGQSGPRLTLIQTFKKLFFRAMAVDLNVPSVLLEVARYGTGEKAPAPFAPTQGLK